MNRTEIRDQQIEDALLHLEDSLVKSIDESTRVLGSFESQKDGLFSELESLKSQIEKLDKDNRDFSVEFKGSLHSDNANLGFFDQLKILESKEEHVSAQIAAIRQNNQEMTNEISSLSAKQRKLIMQLEDTKNEIGSKQTLRQERISYRNQIYESIMQKESTIEETEMACNNLLNEITQKSDELQHINNESFSVLLEQKNGLVDQVRIKSEQLQSLMNTEKQLQSKTESLDTQRKKQISKKVSPMEWMNERQSYQIKIKKAREELNQLNDREKSLSKSLNRSSSLKASVNWNDDDIKKALVLEEKSVSSLSLKFLESTILTEKHYQDDILNEIKRIDDTIATIQGFKESVVDQYYECDRNNRLNDVLKVELNEIKASKF